MTKTSTIKALTLLGIVWTSLAVQVCATPIFEKEVFTGSDAILVVGQSNNVVFEWQANKAMVPASLTKLATAYLAIKKWGVDHRFKTDFLIRDDTLWVKGYGDPFIVSEELDLIVAELKKRQPDLIKSIYVDNSYFNIRSTPGRSRVTDPYNAPLSAVAANFNTARLTHKKGVTTSAEPQTPLTATARGLATRLSRDTERINLMHADNAQQNFAELLAIKLGLKSVNIKINQQVPPSARLFYQHFNSHTLADVLRGTLEFSNNFMANQVFLKLSDEVPLNFKHARVYAETALACEMDWSSHTLREGSGLSRLNRLSAHQINGLLSKLRMSKHLFKRDETLGAVVHAKTGTLDGVRSFAGYIDLAERSYQFVFIFNRNVPWRYREQLLQRLIQDLKK